MVAGDVIEVLGVHVGTPMGIGAIRGEEVVSAIGKMPVTEPAIEVGVINLAGDDQADRTVHGGVDKAIYAYPSEHYAAWRTEGFGFYPGDVGENLVLRGALEHEVHIGSIWRWGSALVQVSQPRSPCYKLTMYTARRTVGPTMIVTGRTGWYLRVLEPGEAPTAGAMTLIDAASDQVTVAETSRAFHDRDVSPELVARSFASPDLAPPWRDMLIARHGDPL